MKATTPVIDRILPLESCVHTLTTWPKELGKATFIEETSTGSSPVYYTESSTLCIP